MGDAQALLDLRTRANELTRLRSEAEGSIASAQTQLEQTNAKIKALGIDPENAEQELQALEDQLATMEQELSAAIDADRQDYLAILASTKAALGGQQS